MPCLADPGQCPFSGLKLSTLTGGPKSGPRGPSQSLEGSIQNWFPSCNRGPLSLRESIPDLRKHTKGLAEFTLDFRRSITSSKWHISCFVDISQAWQSAIRTLRAHSWAKMIHFRFERTYFRLEIDCSSKWPSFSCVACFVMGYLITISI